MTTGKMMRIPLLRLCLISIMMLAGCQSPHAAADMATLGDESFDRLWRIYSHCRSSVDPDEMREDLRHLSRAVHNTRETGYRPWFLPQSLHHMIEKPPLRVSVDPGAMAIACALYAGQAAQADGQTQMAAELFDFVLSKEQEPPYIYYVTQARLALIQIQSQAERISERLEPVIKVVAH
ncbi:hypothetical protein [Nitrospira sp. Nam74]